LTPFFEQPSGRLLEGGVVGDLPQAQGRSQLGPVAEDRLPAVVVGLEELAQGQQGEELGLGVVVPGELGGGREQRDLDGGQGGACQRQGRFGHGTSGLHTDTTSLTPKRFSTEQLSEIILIIIYFYIYSMLIYERTYTRRREGGSGDEIPRLALRGMGAQAVGRPLEGVLIDRHVGRGRVHLGIPLPVGLRGGVPEPDVHRAVRLPHAEEGLALPAPRLHPRDFQGGRDRAQLYTRIMLGVPGTPMPSSTNFKPDEVGDLINYIQSLSDASTPARVEHHRTRLVVRRASGALADEIPDAAWKDVAPTSIVVSPLWWRDFADPDLRVQAMHDGKTLAVRLSWRDQTRDAQAIRPQNFPDLDNSE
jgi:hypothetical protein